MITVYEGNEKKFNHNGLGTIVPSSCYVVQELNGGYYLELEHTKDYKNKYKKLSPWNIIKVDNQLFRIPMMCRNQNDNFNIKIKANHVFYDLSNDFNEDIRKKNINVEDALRLVININNRFKVLECSNLGMKNLDLSKENPATSILKNILPNYKGELYRDNFNISIKDRIGIDTGMLISYGKNIKGFEETLDYTSIATRIKPLGKDGLTVESVNSNSQYLESPIINKYPFVITKEIKFDDINNPLELKLKTQSLWGNIDLPSKNYKINFVDLRNSQEYYKVKKLYKLNIGDRVTIRHKIFGLDINARVIKTKKNILTGKLEEIELGDFKNNLIKHLNNVDYNFINTKNSINKIQTDLVGTKTEMVEKHKEVKNDIQKLYDTENERKFQEENRKKEIENIKSTILTLSNEKLDKVSGKQLSTEDYTTLDKNKLLSIEENANRYIHPLNHNASIIIENKNKRFVTDSEKSIWNSKSNSNHTHDDIYYTETEVNNKFVTKELLENNNYGYMIKSIYDKNSNGKVDMAENAEKLGGKSVSDFAPNGFGLGSLCREAHGDWNNYCYNTGFYMGESMKNSPGQGWYYVIIMVHRTDDSGWCCQMGLSFTDNKFYLRNRVNGQWSDWKSLLNKHNSTTWNDLR